MSKPNVLILTRGEQQEARVKKLLPSAARSVEASFWRATLDNSLAAAREAGLSAIVSSSSPITGVVTVRQQGESFFDRLRNAEFSARNAGDSLIIVAADVPQLSVDHLSMAAERVERPGREVVLGPTSDGGVYLIASKAPITHLLSEVRWRTRYVAADLKRILRQDGFEIFWLATLHDVDDSRDLHAALRRSLASLSGVAQDVLRVLRFIGDALEKAASLSDGRLAGAVVRGPPGTPAHFAFL